MALELHQLKPNRGSHHRYKRVGRGNASGKGTTAGRGTKGQRARQGGRKGLIQLGVKHFVQRLPKVRGWQSFKLGPQVVSVSALAKFEAGTQVTPESLQQHGLIVSRQAPVKLIGSQVKLPPKLTVKVHRVSAGARAAVEAAGGTIELLEM